MKSKKPFKEKNLSSILFSKSSFFKKARKKFLFKYRLKLTLMISLFFFLGYKTTQFLSAHTFDPISLELPGEALIPFVPASLFIYISVYLIFPIAFLLLNKLEDFEKLALVFLITSLVHYAFFLLMPVHFTLRPDLENGQGVLASLIRLFYTFDQTTNCFPSMHVSFAFLSYYGMKKFRPEHAPIFLFMALAISLSTLLMKQHYLLDVVSAYLLVVLIKPILDQDTYKVLSEWIQSVTSDSI
jgi:membrane-associated phospholipid phosphatase